MVGIFHGYVSHNQMVSLVIGFGLSSFPIYKWLLTPPTPPICAKGRAANAASTALVLPACLTHRSQEMLVEWGNFPWDLMGKSMDILPHSESLRNLRGRHLWNLKIPRFLGTWTLRRTLSNFGVSEKRKNLSSFNGGEV